MNLPRFVNRFDGSHPPPQYRSFLIISLWRSPIVIDLSYKPRHLYRDHRFSNTCLYYVSIHLYKLYYFRSNILRQFLYPLLVPMLIRTPWTTIRSQIYIRVLIISIFSIYTCIYVYTHTYTYMYVNRKSRKTTPRDLHYCGFIISQSLGTIVLTRLFCVLLGLVKHGLTFFHEVLTVPESFSVSYIELLKGWSVRTLYNLKFYLLLGLFNTVIAKMNCDSIYLYILRCDYI